MDPRFVNTLQQILKSPEWGGLTLNNLVYRYDVSKTDDGVGGKEGTFCLCTLWCVEASWRVREATALSGSSDVRGLCTEEISEAGDAPGNAVQGFTTLTQVKSNFFARNIL
ncbi:glycoside hydrolase family 15 protein [Scleroderma citrinum Foug A]|uniref:Glycoside hydrolase family 15 protein n=1 Tax=Scleroderma citrinum Foug A TaxID=1036808 RepID=A0A0C3A7C8_9AGAM|nr:glycoside hydrolase family 15 protein [Scleroderma citrinum Foug A]